MKLTGIKLSVLLVLLGAVRLGAGARASRLVAPTIVTSGLPAYDSRLGSYEGYLTATGGAPPYSWSCSGLPAGLNCASDGTLSGAASVANGTAAVTVTVTDSLSATAQAVLPLAVYTTPAILTPQFLATGYAGANYGIVNLQSAGATGAAVWSLDAGALPPGLYFNGGASASISGTPTTVGSYAFTVGLTEGAASDSRAFTINVEPRALPPFWLRRGLAGGTLDKLVYSPNFALDRTLIGASYNGRVYLSSDGGYRWQALPLQFASGASPALALPPTFDARAGGDHTILAGVGGSTTLQRSTDLGQTWSPFAALTGGFTGFAQLYYDGATPGRVIALQNAPGLARLAASTDLLNWAPLASGAFGRLTFSPTFAVDRTIFTMVQGGESTDLRRSVDGGASFQVIAPSSYNSDFGSLALSPNFATDHIAAYVSGGLRVSYDGGDHFLPAGGGAAVTGPLAFPSDFDAVAHPWIYATLASGGGTYMLQVSTDFGRSFTPTGTGGMPPAAFAGTFLLSPTFGVDRTIIASGYSGSAMYRSEDGGATWAPADDGLYLQAFTAIAFAPDSPSTMFAGTGQGIYYTTDAGGTWRRSAISGNANWPLAVTQFAVSPAFASDRTVFAFAYDASISTAFALRSTDGGRSFGSPASFPQTPYLAREQLAVSPNFPVDQRVFFSAGQVGSYFYVSYNGGNSYVATGPGINGAENITTAWRFGVSPDYANDGTIFLNNRYSFPATTRSTDGGLLFYAQPSPPWPGYTWLAPTLSPDYSRTAVASGTNKTLFDGCKMSTDDGATFAPLPSLACGNLYPAPNYPATGRLIASDGGDNYYDGSSRLYRHDGAPGTETNGATWTELLRPGSLPFGNVSGVAYSPNYATDHTIAVAAGAGVFLSTDHGATFNQLTGADTFNPDVTAVAVDPNDATHLFIGTLTQGVAFSTDEGASGVPINQGFPAGAVRDLLAVGNPAVLLAATDAGLYRRTDFTTAGSWSQVASGQIVRLRLEEGATRIFATRVGGAPLTSLNQGLSWSIALAPLIADARDIVRVPGGGFSGRAGAGSAATLWAASAGGGARYSANNGATWLASPGSNDYTLPAGSGWTTVQPMGINAASGGREVAIGHNALGVFLTRDGGDTWRNVSGPGSGLELTSKNVVAFLTSTTASGNIDLLVGIAGATNGGVYLSGDGGEHWTQINQGFDPNNLSITSLVKTACAGCPVQYYSGTYGSGVYTRTVAVNAPPVFPSATNACFGSTACACAAGGGGGPQQGGQPFKLCGTGFQPGIAVEFDGVPATGCAQTGGSVVTCAGTPPHAPGAAVIRVRNPDTRAGALPAAYTYAPGTPRAGNSLRVARSGGNAALSWSCGACTSLVPARLYRAQNGALTLYPEAFNGGTGGAFNDPGALSSPRSYFWTVE